jgi:hypothetical protein
MNKKRRKFVWKICVLIIGSDNYDYLREITGGVEKENEGRKESQEWKHLMKEGTSISHIWRSQAFCPNSIYKEKELLQIRDYILSILKGKPIHHFTHSLQFTFSDQFHIYPY